LEIPAGDRAYRLAASRPDSRGPLRTVVRFLFATLPAAAQPAADLALVNGNVWTGDEKHPRAEAVAYIGSRIEQAAR
jgi:hypothetical protein